MTKIGVLGAGISGLSFAKLARNNFDIELLEKNSECGGIARTKNVNGITYHTVGGHCFNSKYPEVLDFVFNDVLHKDEWHLVERNAVIKLRNNEIGYPIEYNLKDIYNFDKGLALNITKDFLNAEDDGSYNNLEEWFRKKFGDTLADLYFIPYNNKIWNKHPSEMSPAWVEGKLPIPDKMSFFKGLMEKSNDKMPHASFYYPNTDNQNTFIDALAKDLDIKYNYDVEELYFNESTNKWMVNGEKEFDYIVSTLPLNLICNLIKGVPEDIKHYSDKLRYNSVTTMLWETQPTSRTWTYIPEGDNFFHRYIHIGNFFKEKKNYTITEVVGKKSYDEMVQNGKKDSFLIQPLDYNVSDHAYVVFDQNYNESTGNIKRYLNSQNIKTLGRFGEWEYYNMDVCIKKSMELLQNLKDTIL